MSLEQTVKYLENLEKAKRMSVDVGLPKGKATSKIYTSGKTVVEIGAIHEYGAGKVATRSFLRVPFAVKKADIGKTLKRLFKAVAERGAPVGTQLEKAGVVFQNISKEAFETQGFGTWAKLKKSTERRKGSTGILIDKGVLRQSITYEVKDVA